MVKLVCSATADFKGCTSKIQPRIKVVGVGSCCVDYLASVAAYPKPDEKLRTQELEVQGGGNCGNALTAASRLGLSPAVISKIGGDGLGDAILRELEEDGIDTSYILRAAGYPSPFTYIIVDRSGGSRTCIHTPGASLTPEELDGSWLQKCLEGAALVYFDGRLTEAALKVAEAAKNMKIPILVEGERLRPNLDVLLNYADYVVTSAHFPQDFTGEASLGDALVALAQRLPHVSLLVTTLGSRGSIMLERQQEADVEASVSLDDVITSLSLKLTASNSNEGDDDGEPVCMSNGGQPIRAGRVAQSPEVLRLGFSRDHNATAAEASAREFAQQSALRQADSARAQLYYSERGQGATSTQEASHVLARVTMANIASVPQGSIVDTTGAGDAFIGSILYGLCTGMDMARTLQLASVVAACKCCAPGARGALPRRDQITADLLA